jgi:hypothetical protein
VQYAISLFLLPSPIPGCFFPQCSFKHSIKLGPSMCFCLHLGMEIWGVSYFELGGWLGDASHIILLIGSLLLSGNAYPVVSLVKYQSRLWWMKEFLKGFCLCNVCAVLSDLYWASPRKADEEKRQKGIELRWRYQVRRN